MVSRTAISALLLVSLSLTGLIAWLHWNDKKTLSEQVLLPKEQVTRIAIATPDDQLLIERIDEQWWLSQSASSDANNTPSDTPASSLLANSDRVEPLLNLLTPPQRHSYTVNDINLAELGLSPPQASVTLNELLFQFGNRSPDGNARFVRVDDQVHLYNEFVFPLISAGVDAFIASDADAQIVDQSD